MKAAKGGEISVKISIFQGGQVAFHDLPEELLKVAAAINPSDERIHQRLKIAQEQVRRESICR